MELQSAYSAGKTESALTSLRSNWMAAMPGPPPADPVALNPGAPVLTVRPDPEAVHEAHKAQMCGYAVCCFVCLPCLLCSGAPCILLCGKRDSYVEFAQGRSYTLTDRAIIYKLEEGALRSPDLGPCCSEGRVTQGVEIIVPLDENFAFTASSETEFCCYKAQTYALLVDDRVVARIDFVKDMDRLIAAIGEQQAKAQLGDIDPTARAVHRIVLDFHAFTGSQEMPTRVVRSGSDTRTEIDKGQLQFQARMFYDNMMARIEAVHMSNVPLAAPVGEMAMARDVVQVVSGNVYTASGSSFAASGNVYGPTGFLSGANYAGNADNVARLSTQEVQNMLRELNLHEKYGAAFEKRNVDGAVMSLLDDAALQELGVASSLDRKTILAWVIRNRTAAASLALA